MRFLDVFILYWSVVGLECCVSVPQSDSVTVTGRLFFSFFPVEVVPEYRVAPPVVGSTPCRFTVRRIAVRPVGSPRLLICRRGCLQRPLGAGFVFTASGLPWRRGLRPPPLLRSFCFSAGGAALRRLPSASADPPLPPDEDHLCAKVAFPGAGRLLSPCNVS